MSEQSNLKKTPLHDDHIQLGARMVPFGGWSMPVQYTGILEEYEQTRRRAALFDTSHMGEFVLEGDLVDSGLDRAVTMTLADMPVKTCRYGMMLNESGGIIDDLIVFRCGPSKWLMVVNGATTEKDKAHLTAVLNPSAHFVDISSTLGKLDLQGPLSREILKRMTKGIEKLDYYAFDYFDILGENVLISRTGYTGELGYEIYYPLEKTVNVWRELLARDEVKPAGLGARDILRLEMGYSLYGHELSEEITPLEAGLSRFVDFEKDFIGKDALESQKAQGMGRGLIGFISKSRRSPRADQSVYSPQGDALGIVTSGSFSPHLQKGIGLALVKPGQVHKDDTITFGSEASQAEALVSGRLFYKEGTFKS